MSKAKISRTTFQMPLIRGKEHFGTFEIEIVDIRHTDDYEINEVTHIDQSGIRHNIPLGVLHFLAFDGYPFEIEEACNEHVASLLHYGMSEHELSQYLAA